MDSCTDIKEVVAGIKVLDAIYWLNTAIQNLTENTKENTVPNCFRKAGSKFNGDDNGNQDEDEDDEDNLALSELRPLMARAKFDDSTVDEFISLDDDIMTENDTFYRTADSNVEILDDEENEGEEEEGAVKKSNIVNQLIY